jgi:hypothetical protein
VRDHRCELLELEGLTEVSLKAFGQDALAVGAARCR